MDSPRNRRRTPSPTAIPPQVHFDTLERRVLLSTIVGATSIINGFYTPVAPLRDLTDNHGTLLYANDDGIHGTELWRSDGSTNTLVKDIRPGGIGALTLPSNTFNTFVRDNQFLTISNTTYFVADDGTSGVELWRSDGTAAGTSLVRDIVPGAGASSPTFLTNVNGTLFFFISTTSGVLQLWKSNGTGGGTVMVRDLGASSVSTAPTSSFISLGSINVRAPIAVLGASFFFLKTNVSNVVELWKSDGTPGGTARLATTVSLNSASVYAVDSRLYIADDAGGDLWSLDPASGAATRLANLTDGAEFQVPISLDGGKDIFAVAWRGDASSFEIWSTDGTSGGTQRVFETHTTAANSAGVRTSRVGNVIFVTDGSQLYKTDGTPTGTMSIPYESNVRGISNLVALNGSAYFISDDTLYQTDVDSIAAVAVAELVQRGNYASEIVGPSELTASGGRLFLVAAETRYKRGGELWAYNPQSPRKKLRMLLSIQPEIRLENGNLAVTGTRWYDLITVSADVRHHRVTVDWNGFPSLRYALDDVHSVLVNGGADNDALTLLGPVPRATLVGGDGADELTGGDLDDILEGRGGDDRLMGAAGNDDLYGGDGNDNLDGGAGRDVFIGGEGDDSADYSSRTRNLVITANGVRDDGEKREGDNVMADVETLFGGAGNDYLVASSARKPSYNSHDAALQGGDGNDTLLGGVGDDSLVGGNHADSIDGGAGNDTIRGDIYYDQPVIINGDDTLSGGVGNDSIYGGAGNDILGGGKGNDELHGEEGNDMAPETAAATPSTATPEMTLSTETRMTTPSMAATATTSSMVETVTTT